MGFDRPSSQRSEYLKGHGVSTYKNTVLKVAPMKNARNVKEVSQPRMRFTGPIVAEAHV